MVNPEFWSRKRVFLTGHSGFKGAWLTYWLHTLGAHVCGYSKGAPSYPNLFEQARIGECCTSIWNDIRNYSALRQAVQDARPDVVIHMAAQALVLPSYGAPVETFEVNTMGTVHLLEAVREVARDTVTLVVTSDKCYRPPVPPGGYEETHPLGGHDPYSASKACAELVVESYRSSFGNAWPLASARAGNVIGGGDWAAHRILPDLARAAATSTTVAIRSPEATRPWQHVLDALKGYLLLVQNMELDPIKFSHGWNFGPSADMVRSVRDLVLVAERDWPSCAHWSAFSDTPHEAPQLDLDSRRAREILGWEPLLDFEAAVRWSVRWYREFHTGSDPRSLLARDLDDYQAGP